MTAPRFWSHTDRSYPFILKDSLIKKSFDGIRYKLRMSKSQSLKIEIIDGWNCLLNKVQTYILVLIYVIEYEPTGIRSYKQRFYYCYWIWLSWMFCKFKRSCIKRSSECSFAQMNPNRIIRRRLLYFRCQYCEWKLMEIGNRFRLLPIHHHSQQIG